MDERTGWEATPAPTRIIGGLATIAFGVWMTWWAVGQIARSGSFTLEAMMVVAVLLVLLGLYWLVSGIVRAVRGRSRT